MEKLRFESAHAIDQHTNRNMWCSGSTMDCYFSDPGSTPTSACWQVTIVRLADDGFFCT